MENKKTWNSIPIWLVFFQTKEFGEWKTKKHETAYPFGLYFFKQRSLENGKQKQKHPTAYPFGLYFIQLRLSVSLRTLLLLKALLVRNLLFCQMQATDHLLLHVQVWCGLSSRSRWDRRGLSSSSTRCQAIWDGQRARKWRLCVRLQVWEAPGLVALWRGAEKETMSCRASGTHFLDHTAMKWKLCAVTVLQMKANIIQWDSLLRPYSCEMKTVHSDSSSDEANIIQWDSLLRPYSHEIKTVHCDSSWGLPQMHACPLFSDTVTWQCHVMGSSLEVSVHWSLFTAMRSSHQVFMPV